MSFGTYLAAALKRAGYTQRAFALKAKHNPKNFNQIVLGNRAPPLKHIPKWMVLLQGHIEPTEFLELAQLENSPNEIRALVHQLRAKVAGTQKADPTPSTTVK